ncbi:DUF2249 domain-containing protein [Noviherbaspirillum sp. Root189]|uniref:DUF2249 domain-containing protein n=1 Tax=Noviherbaspirillum sp. Root189 TaxID=1736487 RepID=UPI00070D02FB|nr:DUF2249 domain-containing protein [Noviherbaspirillum sp. Root189]KRB67851.1 hypothetical protein ASE07_09295 [Noviherbaspirillum sp. Root189]
MTKEIPLDVCGLEPPEPMERVLEALARLQRDEHIRMIIDREPRPLYRILEQNGYAYTVTPRDGYLFDILIRHRA